MTIDTRKTPAERRDDARREAFANSAAKLTANLTLLPLHAWVLMLVLGATHSVTDSVAAIGYGTALLFILGVDLVAVTTKKFRK
jgi:hypothetical protein